MEQLKIYLDDCIICCDNIDDTNCVFYCLNNMWKQYNVCVNCTKQLLNNKWYHYIDSIKTADCEKALKALLKIKLPTKLTLDTTYYSESIDSLYYNSSYQSSSLVRPSINFEELQKELDIVYNNIINEDSSDYLNDIKTISIKYNL